MKVDVMSSHEVGSVVCGPSRDAAEGVEDAGGENSSSAPAGRADAPCLEESPWLRSRSPESGGRSAMAEQMAKPSLPGRKSTRKAFNTDDRDRTKCSLRERPQGRDEERASVTVKENDRENERPGLKKTEREESVKERPWDRERRSRTQSLVCCYTDHCQTGTAEGGLQTVLPSSSHSPNQGYSVTRSTSPDTWPPQSAVSSACPALHRPPIRTKSSPPLLPPRQSPRTAGAVDLRRHTPPASREMDPFWEEVRTGAAIRRVAKRYQNKARRLPRPISEVGEEEEEERGEEEEEEEEEEEDGEEGGARGGGGGGGVMEVTGPTLMLAVPPTSERRMSKREKNRMKSLRRRQRRRERWRQNQQQENRQSSTGNPSSSSSEDEEEDVSAGDREGYICAVCLDIYFSPYMCHPCSHVFCEPCLRTLARNSPANTPCPLCRTTITHVFFQKELNQTAKTFFPKEYLSRKQNFQKASCAKWPLPSCRKLFRIFGGLQRQSSSMARRQFPHGAGYRLDALDFEDESRGWRLDMDMVIIYIYSVNWVIGFFILCLLCYFFFPSF